ncbi:hypothetical protein [Paludisphaera borealis]|uniref:Knr4/Smi1-like domain-containing protein n=1 Tax=Paludisphaera borealis TaxID=1387353 RepID=A0A1U7CIZ3_9BACT|nr:hypothetical protein [Paludisphaera borealis]APW58878.1 hypothetical protein BSF38_00286 [Paludisphaera borealis]
MGRDFGPSEIESVKEFADLFFKSRYYGRVRALPDEEDLKTAAWLPGYTYWVAPSEMISDRDADGTAAWAPIPSPIDRNLIHCFERFLGADLPPLFKCYLCSSSMLCADLTVGFLPQIDPRHPLSWLEWCLRARRHEPFMSSARYVPFAWGPATASYLWFDVESPTPDGDYPIIQTMDRSRHPEPASYRIDRVFDSFGEYFEYLKLWMKFTADGMPEHMCSWVEKNPLKHPPRPYFD